MKLRVCLFLWIYALLASPGLAQPRVVEGVLDLRGHSLTQAFEVSGDWEFYWQKLLVADQLPDHANDRTLIKVPGNWYRDTRHSLSVFGYGTYRVRILLDQPDPFVLEFAEIWSASRVLINGREVAVYGQPGTDAKSYRGRTGMSHFIVTPESRDVDVLVQVSNFDIFLSGITKVPKIGPIGMMGVGRDRALAVDILVVGALLMMAIYHLCLFVLRTEDKSTLCFAIVCFFVATYTATVGAEALITIWPETSFAWRLRILNFSWMMAAHAFIWFAWILFQPHFKKKMAIIGSWIACVHHLLCLTTEPRIFVNMSLLFEFVVIPILVHTYWAAWKSRHARKGTSGIFLLGTIILVLATVNDILAIQRSTMLPPIGGFGVLAFILVQSYLLAHRFSLAFIKLKHSERDVRDLSENLKQVNENLEMTVEDKTRDIRSIMQYIPIGIFIMSGPNGVIARDYSRHLKQIFLHNDLEGLEAAQLLLSQSQLTEDEKSQAMSAIYSSLNELDLNFDMNSTFLPLHIRRQDPEGLIRLYDLTWDKIVNEAGITEKILVTIRDVTELKSLQIKSLVHQEELGIIGEILSVTPARFNRFMQSAMDLLAESERLLHEVESGTQDFGLLKILFINIHTIKGASRSLYFKTMTEVLHEMEQFYA
ncbi:MAG: Hpt domain-containing protein, partial [Pseudobdellovibrionaceae bacterium]|nr:Hpt domain-containing protein [Pseudobdellovibrionaceae bacterium]